MGLGGWGPFDCLLTEEGLGAGRVVIVIRSKIDEVEEEKRKEDKGKKKFCVVLTVR